MEPEEIENNQSRTRSYLKNSLSTIPLYRARYHSQISEDERMELVLHELSLVGKEVEQKSLMARCKANLYKFINALSSLSIIIGAAVIIGLEAASSEKNIPVIVISSVIFFIEGAGRVFKWGPLGVLFKEATVRLNRIYRQTRDLMYEFHKYTADQMMTIISYLRSQYDDIDLNLYSMSMAGPVKFNGQDIETGHPHLPLSNPPFTSQTPATNNDSRNDSGSHFHIHIDRSESTPVPINNRNNTVSLPIINRPDVKPYDREGDSLPNLNNNNNRLGITRSRSNIILGNSKTSGNRGRSISSSQLPSLNLPIITEADLDTPNSRR